MNLSQSKYSRSSANCSTTFSRLYDSKELLIRKRPNKTELDSENLFQESLKLNDELTRLNEENQTIKTKLDRVDEIRNYKQTLIFSVQNIIKEKAKQLRSDNKTSSWLVYNLKKKINKMNTQLEAKEKEIQRFDRSNVALVLKEKEMQIKALQALVESHIVGGNSPEPNDVLDQLVQMRMYEQSQQQHIRELQECIRVEESNVRQILSQITLKKAEIDMKNQGEKNRRKIEEMNILQMEIERVNMESEQAKQNAETVRDLETMRDMQAKQIGEMEQRMDRMINRENLERKKLEGLVAELERKVMVKESTKTSSVILKQIDSAKEKEAENIAEVVEEEKEKGKEKPHLLVSQLKLQDVRSIGEYLRYNFATRKLSPKDWKPLINSVIDEESISIEQIIPILLRQPFCLKCQEIATRLSRYLVEEAQGKHLFDPSTRQSISIVKSILEKVIGPVLSYSPSQEISIREQIYPVVQKYSILVIGAFEIKANKQPFVSMGAVSQVFEDCTIELSKQQLEYIILFLFSFSDTLDKLEYRNLLKMGETGVRYQ